MQQAGEVLPDGSVLLCPAGVRVTALAFRHAVARMRVNGLGLPPDVEAVVRLLVDAEHAGSGSPVVLAAAPEPRAPSGHVDDPWLTTGEAADAVGLSSSYLRRLARRGHPAARPLAEGWQWHRDRLPSPGAARAS